MSEYFSNLPILKYKISGGYTVSGSLTDEVHQKFVTDICLRHKLKQVVKQNFYTNVPHEVTDGMRPDVLSHMYYGSTKYTWLIFLANDIYDPIFEWPHSGKELENLIIAKYGSVSSAQSTNHHYEEIIQHMVPATNAQSRIEQKTIEIHKDRYDYLVSLTSEIKNAKSITNYDYELSYNDSKAEIQLIARKHAEDILSESKKILRTGVSSEF